MRAQIETESALPRMEHIRAFVRSICQETGVDEEAMMQLELATSEVVSNIVRHAYQGRPDQRIMVEIEADGNMLVIHFCHWGESFDPQVVEPPSFDGSRDHGFGLYIIQQCVDQVEYGCDVEGKKYVRLIKECHVPQNGMASGESQVG